VSRERISACLIVQDEQERLPGTLASLDFCDETIVVDGGSGDDTVELARAAGATVIENRWPGFATQRNVAIDAAGGDWILEIDADERVSAQLRASIQALLASNRSDVEIAACALRNRFLGGPLGPSAKYPAYRMRLFRRGAYRHDESRMVHEGIEPRVRPFLLDGDLEHELASSLREALLDAWRYARLESSHLQRPTRPDAYLTGIALRPAAKLVYRAILEGGWRDGWRGMLKISLDAASDALVWILVLLRRAPASAARAPAQSEHFGRRPAGPVKIVALAGGAGATRKATRWLAEIRSRGLDVALIAPERDLAAGSPAEAAEGGVPLHPIRRLAPLAALHALDVEMQIRTIDAVVAVGRRARLVRRLVPGTLRPEIPSLGVTLDAEQAVEIANAAARRP
jgi:hypothetical protein